jgi:hypothetical protein
MNPSLFGLLVSCDGRACHGELRELVSTGGATAPPVDRSEAARRTPALLRRKKPAWAWVWSVVLAVPALACRPFHKQP